MATPLASFRKSLMGILFTENLNQEQDLQRNLFPRNLVPVTLPRNSAAQIELDLQCSNSNTGREIELDLQCSNSNTGREIELDLQRSNSNNNLDQELDLQRSNNNSNLDQELDLQRSNNNRSPSIEGLESRDDDSARKKPASTGGRVARKKPAI